jgi:hypothetical protein
MLGLLCCEGEKSGDKAPTKRNAPSGATVWPMGLIGQHCWQWLVQTNRDEAGLGLISARPASEECIARNVIRYTHWSLKAS